MAKKEITALVSDEILMHKIYFIRGYKVILDNDLAELYEVETRVLNQAVNRNIERFPTEFMFQLTDKEWENLKSQFVTSSWGGRRKLPNVFTEHGVLMLSSVLNSNRAIRVNILIVKIFIRIRKMLIENTELRLAIEKLEKRSENHSKNIELLFQYFDESLKNKTTKEKQESRKLIGYKTLKNK